jgi:NADH dehydrogenase FAD-containing subunit
MAMRRVVVLGAGYAGVMAANRIAAARRPEVEVTVVNPRPEFVQRIRLHQHAVGSGDARLELEDVLAAGVRVRVGRADTIASDVVTLTDGSAQPFDYLVYAVGGRAACDRPGRQHLHAIGSLDAAERLRAALAALGVDSPVAVVGGGLTAIETAAEIAEQLPHLPVRVVAPAALGAGMSPRARALIGRRMADLHVTVIRATATGFSARAVHLGDGTTLPSACTVWAGGFVASDLAARSGLPVDPIGRLRTDATLRCLGRPSIVGAGDAAAPPTPLRASCQAALPLGAHAGDTVIAQLRGVAPRPFSLGFAGQAVSLGRHRAVLHLTRRDDRSPWATTGGRPAAWAKEAVCRSTLVSLRHAQAYRWLPAARTSAEPGA